MAEVAAVIGLTASIVQLIEASRKVWQRIQNFRNGTIFRNINAQLPLLQQTLERIQTAQKQGALDSATQQALSGAINGCLELITDLDAVVTSMTPADTSSKFHRGCKGIRSFGKDRSIKDIQAKLDRSVSRLSCYFSVDSSLSSQDVAKVLARNIPAAWKSPEDRVFFEVPALQVSCFVGREELLDRINLSFMEHSASARVHVTVLLGMGGQGKTQIALEYCARTQNNYQGIFWIDSFSESSVLRSFEKIALKLKAPESVATASLKVDFVKTVLIGWSKPWMLIFDNYDNPISFNNLKAYFPSGHGNILCTSRNADTTRLGTTIRVDSLTEDEGLHLLLHRSQHDWTDDSIAEGRVIVRQLGCLAVAIDQAAAYITFRQLPLTHFGDHYNKHREEVLRHTPESLWEYRRQMGEAEKEVSLSVFTTWEMSFQQTPRDHNEKKSIDHFLTLSAFLDTARISEDLFESYFTESHPEWMQIFDSEGNWSADKFQDTICRLLNLSLIQNVDINGVQTSFSLHPIIRDWLQLRQKHQQPHDYSREAMRLLSVFIQTHNPSALTLQGRNEILSHIEICVQLEAVHRGPDFSDSLQTLIDLNALINFVTTGPVELYKGAETLELWRLAASERLLGRDDEFTLFALRKLGEYYFFQGRLGEAERTLQQALQGTETLLDPNHVELVSILDLLAKTYDEHDRLEDAEAMYQRAWRTEEAALGSDDDRTLMARARLGMFYIMHNDCFDGETFLNGAMGLLEKSQGPYTEREPITYLELGNLYCDNDRLAEAEVMYGRALREFSKGHGPQAWGINMTKLALGVLCLRAGRDREAECYMKQAQKGCENIYGPLDVLTLCIIYGLADLCFVTGRSEEAETYCEQARSGCGKILDPQRPVTIKLVFQLGRLFKQEERFEDAEVYFRLAAENYMATLGPAHNDTISSVFELARVLHWKGQYADAEGYYVRAKEGYEKSSNPDEVLVAHNQYYLGLLYHETGRWEKAEASVRRARKCFKKTLGTHDDAAITSLWLLGRICERSAKLKEAEAYLKRARTDYKRTQGAKDPKTIAVARHLHRARNLIASTASGNLTEEPRGSPET
ncbi:MAG: hypothetical protein M1830_002210 [Pleopsidium flavum]|nr:MAG: hypothetical protein M1830_002210 [Pleopsidium flavum]